MLEINKKTLRRIIFGAIACIFVYWLLHETERVRGFFGAISDLLAPFAVGGILAFILNVPMRAIENSLLKKIAKNTLKRIISVVLTFLALLLVLTLVFWLLIPQLVNTINSLVPNMRTFIFGLRDEATQFVDNNPDLLKWLNDNTNYSTIKWDTVAERLLAILGSSTSAILGSAFSVVATIFKEIFNALISVVFCV